MLPADQRWCLYRRLFEQHAVSAHTLSEIARLKETTITSRMKRENWSVTQSFIDERDALKQLVSLFFQQLQQLKDASCEKPTDDKSSRLLTSLTRTFEALLDLNAKVITAGKKETSSLAEYPEGTMVLDAQIEKLVEGLVQSGPVKRTVPTA